MTSIALKDRGEMEKDSVFVKDGMRLSTRTFWSVYIQKTQLRNGNLKVRGPRRKSEEQGDDGFQLITLLQ